MVFTDFKTLKEVRNSKNYKKGMVLAIAGIILLALSIIIKDFYFEGTALFIVLLAGIVLAFIGMAYLCSTWIERLHKK
jgi:glucose uptake protein GlcU